ncbi:penicillin-binding transpeptidase domain-containing protein [Ahrensia marina]|jgi:beta-lactamase class D|uniref:penicillin-binding transpeptidase domain-containing protein n=1 Tax=Ahrensia marina TaxID=1514904 RepID=UPI0035D0ABBB
MKHYRNALATVLASFALLTSAQAQQTNTATLPLAPHQESIEDRDVSFLAYDLETNTRYVLEGSDLQSRHAPWSTFKIPNLIIALDSGFTPDLDTVRPWDQQTRPASFWWPDAWRQEQSLRTAFQRSAVWYFRDIAQHVGASTYRTQLTAWDYGNAGAPDGSDSFWLSGALEISVEEQVAFLASLLTGELGVPDAQLAALTEASLAREINEHALHGKTGGGPVVSGNFSGPFEGWYVGFVDRTNAMPVVFALHTQGPSWNSIREFRQSFTTRLLIEANLLPAGFGD